MSHGDITIFFLALALLLASARVLGELAQRFGQPAVLGEMLAGVLLGPTLFGRIAPELQALVFPEAGPVRVALQGLSTLAVTFFLLVAGLEMDLKAILRQGRAALAVGAGGIVIPFGIGFGLAWLMPAALGGGSESPQLPFALFMATALSISALPVIAKTLMDLGLFRTDLGMVVMAAGVINDLFGWLVFALLLGMLGQGAQALPFETTVIALLGFVIFTLTIGRRLLHKILPWLQAHVSWPGGVLGFAFALALLGASFTEWLGVHAVFGAFIVGVALGDSSHLDTRTKATVEQFVSFVFAPLFFASIGLHLNFVANFDLGLTLTLVAIAAVGKLLGTVSGGLIGGFSLRESAAIGSGMLGHGAMEIILGLVALEAGVIDTRLFVALVVMAITTSMLSGPLMQRILRRRKPLHFQDFLSESGYVGHLSAKTRFDAIVELASAAATSIHTPAKIVIDAVWGREQQMPTGLTHRIAVPHARIAGLKQPVVALGYSRAAIDFEAPDGDTSQIVALVLFPEDAADTQWAIIGDIARTFADPNVRERAQRASSLTELRALLRVVSETGSTATHGSDEERKRNGYVIVGARPVACELALRLQAAGTPTWIVDTNRNAVERAQNVGLSVILGNALSDVTLLKAHAFEAQGILALTHNSQANADIAAFACQEFAIPQGFALGADIDDNSTLPLFQPESLANWDRYCTEEQVEWRRVEIETADVLHATVIGGMVGLGDALPLLVERQNRGYLAVPGMQLHVGDVIGVLTVTERLRPDNWMLDLLDKAPVVEFEAPVGPEEFFRRAAQALAGRLHMASEELAQRFIDHENFQPTILTSALAAPHLIISGQGIIELVLCRGKAGMRLGAQAAPLPVALVIVTSIDERPRYLKLLAALAEVAQDNTTLADWQAAGDGEDFRQAVRLAFAGRTRTT